MLEGYLKGHLGSKARVYSAGTEPSGVDPQAIRVMAEDRVVIAGQTSDSIAEYQNRKFDLIIVLDASAKTKVLEYCQFDKIQNLELPEIHGFGGAQRMESVRQLRNQLKSIATELAAEIIA